MPDKNINNQQLSRSDIQSFSTLASDQQILRKITVGSLHILLSAEDNHTLEGNDYVGMDIALFTEQATLTGTLKAQNVALSTDVFVLGDRAMLNTSGDNGQPIPGVAVKTIGQPGNQGTSGGFIYLYVNDFFPHSKPLGIQTKGGNGGSGQSSEDSTGGTGGKGGDGGDVVILFSNSYLLAQNYLKKIAYIVQNASTSHADTANLAADIQAFCSILAYLYPTPASQKAVKISNTLTLADGLTQLKKLSSAYSQDNATQLLEDFKPLIIDFNSMMSILNSRFETEYLRQQLNATGGDLGLGGEGDGGTKNGLNGTKGQDGTVTEVGFISSQNLIEGRLEPSFFQRTPPFLFLHPNQCQMVLEKARLEILFSDPSTDTGITHIKGAKNLLDRLTFKTQYFTDVPSDAPIVTLYQQNEYRIGCQNSITTFQHVYNEATQLSNQVIQGLDAYGHSYNYAPRGTYQMYKSALNQMIDAFIEIETAYLQYSKELSEQNAQISHLTERTAQLNGIQNQVKENLGTLIGDISHSVDLIESFSAQLAPFKYTIQDDITQIVDAVKISFDFDVKSFLGSLTSIAFAPESALMWGTQATSILYSGMTNIKNDQGIDVKKSYLVQGIKQISGTIKAQTLAEGFQQLNSGIIQLDDPGGNKILTDERQLMALLDQFYAQFPSKIDSLKETFQNYISLLQKRNSEVLHYNQLLITAEKEIIASEKAKMIVKTINQKKFNNTDPALPEIASYMAFIYNHAKSQLLGQLYRTSRAFDFWSVTKTNILANNLNGLTPEKVDSYLLQGINLDLETAFEKSPGSFSSPKGSFSGNEALTITLGKFELGLLQVAHSTTVSIPIPKEGAFYGRADIRLTQVAVTLELTSESTKDLEVFIDVAQLGKETIQNPSNLEWYNYDHSPVVVQCGFNIKSKHIHPASLVSNISIAHQPLQLANIGPYATWRISIDPKKNVGFDLKHIQSMTLAFDGTFYNTISS